MQTPSPHKGRYHFAHFAAPEDQVYVHTYVTRGTEPSHTHDFLELVYIRSGRGRHVINGREFAVQRGSMLFIPLGQTHAFRAEGDMELFNCLIRSAYLEQELLGPDTAREILALSSYEDFTRRAEKLVPLIPFEGRDREAVEALLDMMTGEAQEQRPGYRVALRGCLLTLFTHLLRRIQTDHAGGILHQIDRIAPDLLRYIEDNYTKRLSLAELAGRCFYNPSYFSKVFKECFGVSFTTYVTERRVQAADQLLRDTDLSVEEIARQVGYEDRSSFYTAYKRITGISPGARRRTASKDGQQKP